MTPKAEEYLGRLTTMARNFRTRVADADHWKDNAWRIEWAVATIREQQARLGTQANSIMEYQQDVIAKDARIAELESHVKAERLCSRLMGIREGFDAGSSVETKEQEREIAEQAKEIERLRTALTQIEERAQAIHPKTGDSHFIIEIASKAYLEGRIQ